jgi:uncharacterized protein YciI
VEQFVIIAKMRDPKDPETQRRRLEARDAHIAGAAKLAAEGKLLVGGPIFTDEGEPLGSAAVGNFENRAALDEWLRNDPYVTNGVWQDIEILSYKVSPHYKLGPKG